MDGKSFILQVYGEIRQSGILGNRPLAERCDRLPRGGHCCFTTWGRKVPELWVAAEMAWNATIARALNAMAAAWSLTFFEIRLPYPRQRFWLPPDCVLPARKRFARLACHPGF